MKLRRILYMSDKPKMSLTKKVLIAFAVLVVIAAFAGRNGESKKQSEKAPEPAIEYPENETALIDASKKAMDKAKKAENDMQKGSALNERNNAICSSIGSFTVTDWVGTISKIDSNSDGYGVLKIELAKNIYVQTWNNSLSDTFDHTLIKPSTTLFETVSNLKKGQKVKFSGKFFKDDDTCISEGSLSLDGKLKEPEYIFRFSQVTPL